MLFSDPQTAYQLYYVSAEEGCKNNIGDTTFPRVLTRSTFNNDTVIMYEKGVLQIVNSTNDNYSISSSLFNTTVAGNNQFTDYPRAGNYVIHSEQSFKPGTGRETLIQISCGNSSIITIPN